MTNTPAIVADHIITAANAKLSEAVKRNFDEPKSHLQSFSKLSLLIVFKMVVLLLFLSSQLWYQSYKQGILICNAPFCCRKLALPSIKTGKSKNPRIRDKKPVFPLGPRYFQTKETNLVTKAR